MIKMNANKVLLGLLMFVFVGCSEPEKEGYLITGKLTNSNGETIYLDELNSKVAVEKNTAVIDENGEFTIQGSITHIGFYRLRIADNNFVNIILDTGDEITIKGDATNLFYTYKITGSPEAQLLYEFNNYLKQFTLATDSLSKLISSFQGTPQYDSVNASVRNAYGKLVNDKENFARKFIDEHSTSLATLAAIENLDPQRDLSYYIKVDKALFKLYPNSEFVKSFHAKTSQMSRLAIGSEAPQLLLNDPDGNTIPMSSLRGKIVLIDFWASWCKPCRFENPHVVKLYNEYKDKGFEIYGVSLDKSKAAWVQAIAQDGLEWIHVSDLGFWNSAAVKLYDIKSIPQTYLIDGDGIIIARGLRAVQLKIKLQELLG